MENINHFNIRVYGLLLENNRLLIEDQEYKKRDITKFPGGGLHFGEGTIECLQRELKEELNMEIEVMEHFYTTDFYQRSTFKESDQVISIYYFIKRQYPQQPINYSWQEVANEQKVKFRWVDIKDFTEDTVTFPIDKKVAKMLLNNLR